MKAVICTKYGTPEVLKLVEIDKPVPKDDEVLIKVMATTVHIGDTKIRRFAPGLGPIKDFLFKPMMRMIIGFRGPRKKVLGMELAGDIVSVGKNVKRFKIGDSVFASTELSFGAHAEYCCLNENGFIALKPVNMSYEESVPVTNAGFTVMANFRKVDIKQGSKVLIYGASGSLGTYAIQIAKYFGAEVTGVCSGANADLVKSLGADFVIDYTTEDFTNNGKNYDLIFDTVGKIPFAKQRKSLSKSGKYLSALSLSSGIKMKIEELLFLTDLCEKGKLRTVIDRVYPFEQIIEAHRYVEKGHKKGNVIITFNH